MKDKILSFIHSLLITEAGIARIKRENSEFKSAVVCLFPYKTADSEKGNISLYARSPDYHIIVKNYLKKIEEYIKTLEPCCITKLFVDTGGGNDRLTAFNAGLGFIGENNLLINERYGSYFFIGYIETNLDLEADLPLQKKCFGCGKCKEACPGDVFSDCDFSRCASHISQKKGELTPFEEEIMLKSGLLWGCDICQKVCPHNENSELTPLCEFYEDRITTLKNSDVLESFNKKYSGYAFSFRGKSVLLRNTKLFEK